MVKDDDEYRPATRPPDAPGGERVRFEREGDYEQSIWGGSARDIERSIMEDTMVNVYLIGAAIRTVTTKKADLGGGQLQEVVLELSGHQRGEDSTLRIAWTETGLVMAVKTG